MGAAWEALRLLLERRAEQKAWRRWRQAGRRQRRSKESAADRVHRGHRLGIVDLGGAGSQFVCRHRMSWLDLAANETSLWDADKRLSIQPLRPWCFRAPGGRGEGDSSEGLPQRERSTRRRAQRSCRQAEAAACIQATWRRRSARRRAAAELLQRVMVRRRERKRHEAAALIGWTWRRRHLLHAQGPEGPEEVESIAALYRGDAAEVRKWRARRGVRWPRVTPVPRCRWGTVAATEADFQAQQEKADAVLEHWRWYTVIFTRLAKRAPARHRRHVLLGGRAVGRHQEDGSSGAGHGYTPQGGVHPAVRRGELPPG